MAAPGPVTRRLAKVFYFAIGAAIVFVLAPLAYHYESTSVEERNQIHAQRVQAERAREQAVAGLFKKTCVKKSDVSGLFTEEFKQFTGKTYQYRQDPVDIVGWECPNRVMYWGRAGQIPQGFRTDYKQQIAEAQVLVTTQPTTRSLP